MKFLIKACLIIFGALCLIASENTSDVVIGIIVIIVGLSIETGKSSDKDESSATSAERFEAARENLSYKRDKREVRKLIKREEEELMMLKAKISGQGHFGGLNDVDRLRISLLEKECREREAALRRLKSEYRRM